MLLIIVPAYFPPISVMACIVNHTGDIAVDDRSNFQKQTIRNRCEIAGANGTLRLTVPLLGWSTKIPMNAIRIDNGKNWRHIHTMSIRSAYANAPYFDHYFPDLDSLFLKDFKYLKDLNSEVLSIVLKWLDQNDSIKPEPVPENIENQNAVKDIQAMFSKKRVPHTAMSPYLQVFSDRLEFQPDLSILDLVFNLGPRSLQYLMNVEDLGAS